MNDLSYTDLVVGFLAIVGGLTLIVLVYGVLIGLLGNIREAWENRCIMHLSIYNGLVYKIGKDTALCEVVEVIRDFIDDHNGTTGWLHGDENVARCFMDALKAATHLSVVEHSKFKARLSEMGLTEDQINLVCTCLFNAIHGEKVTK